MNEVDRRRFVEIVDCTLPVCVLHDIAQSLGIDTKYEHFNMPGYTAEVVDLINTIPEICTSGAQPPTDEDYEKIARYINYDTEIEWGAHELVSMMKKMNRAITSHRIPQEDDLKKIQIGNPTPGNMNKIPVCMWYSWCVFLGGMPDSDMDEHDIKSYCILLKGERSDILDYIKKEVMFFDLPSLALLALRMKNTESQYFTSNMEVNTENIKALHLIYNQISRIDDIIPKSRIDAIYLAKVRDSKDISTFEYPEKYFLGYLEKKTQEILKLNPRAYSCKFNFNPLFPLEMYSLRELEHISHIYDIQIGHFRDDARTVYNELALFSMVDTFHVHAHPNLESFVTSIELLNITEQTDIPVVYYGSICGSTVAYTVEELSDLFTHSKDFSNPRGGFFNSDAIKRLKTIASKESSSSYWDALYRAIARSEIYQSSGDLRSRDFLILYDQSPGHIKTLIVDCLQELMRSAMYMRGWVGSGPYPVKEAPNMDPGGTTIRVCQSLDKFKKECSDLGDIGAHIMRLPLVRFKDGRYNVATSAEQGLTIGERIFIVESGETIKSIHSCIRTSSNYLGASSYKYLEIIGSNPGFNISELRYIS